MGNARNIAFWVVLLILVMALFQLFSGNQTTMSSRSLSYSDFVERVDAGQVSKVVLDGEKVVVIGKDGKIVAFFPSPVTPESAELRSAIDRALAANN